MSALGSQEEHAHHVAWWRGEILSFCSVIQMTELHSPEGSEAIAMHLLLLIRLALAHLTLCPVNLEVYIGWSSF